MAKKLLATRTASSSASLAFLTGINTTYPEYEFQFFNIHPATQDDHWQVQFNAYDPSAGTPQLTGFNETITSTYIRAYNNDADNDCAFGYNTTYDHEQEVTYQTLLHVVDDDTADNCVGRLTLFNPSNAVYAKHFMSEVQGNHHSSGYSMVAYVGGYINTTLAITQVSFKFSSGNIEAGTIKMYGVG